MKEMIEYIVQSLVEHPEQVQIEEELTPGKRIYHLTVARKDTGRVIGKAGRMVKAIGLIASSYAATQHEDRVVIRVNGDS